MARLDKLAGGVIAADSTDASVKLAPESRQRIRECVAAELQKNG
jgi:hypothetical protein